LRGHSGEVNRHRQRRELVLRHLAVQRAVDDIANFLLRELAAIALLLDQEVEAGLDETTGRDVSFTGHELDGCVGGERDAPTGGKVCEPMPFQAKAELKRPLPPLVTYGRNPETQVTERYRSI